VGRSRLACDTAKTLPLSAGAAAAAVPPRFKGQVTLVVLRGVRCATTAMFYRA